MVGLAGGDPRKNLEEKLCFVITFLGEQIRKASVKVSFGPLKKCRLCLPPHSYSKGEGSDFAVCTHNCRCAHVVSFSEYVLIPICIRVRR